MKSYLLMLVVCLISAGASAQRPKGGSDTTALQQEWDRLNRQCDAARKKAIYEESMLNKLGDQLSQSEQARKGYWTTLTSERRQKADSLDKLIVVQTRRRDSVGHLFDRQLMVLDSTLGLMNAIEEKKKALRRQ